MLKLSTSSRRRERCSLTLELAAERDGSFDLKVRVLGNGSVERTAVYVGVGLQASGRARLEIGKNTERANSHNVRPKPEVEADSNGVFEAQIAAAAIHDATGSADADAEPDRRGQWRGQRHEPRGGVCGELNHGKHGVERSSSCVPCGSQLFCLARSLLHATLKKMAQWMCQ